MACRLRNSISENQYIERLEDFGVQAAVEDKRRYCKVITMSDNITQFDLFICQVLRGLQTFCKLTLRNIVRWRALLTTWNEAEAVGERCKVILLSSHRSQAQCQFHLLSPLYLSALNLPSWLPFQDIFYILLDLPGMCFLTFRQSVPMYYDYYSSQKISFLRASTLSLHCHTPGAYTSA